MSQVFSVIHAINPSVEAKLRQELQLTYEIFHKSGSGSGILHLTTLLEGKDGMRYWTRPVCRGRNSNRFV